MPTKRRAARNKLNQGATNNYGEHNLLQNLCKLITRGNPKKEVHLTISKNLKKLVPHTMSEPRTLILLKGRFEKLKTK